MLLFSLPSRDSIYNVSTLAYVTPSLQQNTALAISVENPLYCIYSTNYELIKATDIINWFYALFVFPD